MKIILYLYGSSNGYGYVLSTWKFSCFEDEFFCVLYVVFNIQSYNPRSWYIEVSKKFYLFLPPASYLYRYMQCILTIVNFKEIPIYTDLSYV